MNKGLIQCLVGFGLFGAWTPDLVGANPPETESVPAVTQGESIDQVAWGTSFGFLYEEFGLTLAPRRRVEMLGPLYHRERGWGPEASKSGWALPPLISYARDEAIPSTEVDMLYPIMTYDRYGPEYRWQLIQWLNISGGQTLTETNVNRFTLFPLYFQQRSKIKEKNYTALFPIYGRLKNRFFRDESFWVLWPLYIKSRKRDVITHNYLYPFFHWRRGDAVRGWQFWPVYGRETRDVSYRTNHWDEVVTVGGHRRQFAAWPFWFKQVNGLGTTNVDRRDVFLPFYSVQRSEMRRSFTIPWPLGYSRTVDREQRFREWGAPWPLVVFARGEGKTVNRVLPFFSRGRSPTLEQNSYAWPIYRYRRVTSAPLDRKRTRILFFLYSDMKEKNTETEQEQRRVDFWPLYTWRGDTTGTRRLQILAPLEPIIPNNRGVERNYSPLWSLWRSERNGETGATSQSFLWNLYRRETQQDGAKKKCSLLFGLFQYQSSPEGRRLRLFYIPFGRRNVQPPPEGQGTVADPG